MVPLGELAARHWDPYLASKQQPNTPLFRETAACWAAALRQDKGPSALLLTRQGVPSIEGTQAAFAGVKKGAYILSTDDDPELVLMATGSEVQLIVGAPTMS